MPSDAVTSHRRAPVVALKAAVIHSAPPATSPVTTTSVSSGLNASEVAMSLAKEPVETTCDQLSTPVGLYLCTWMSWPSPTELNAR